MTFTHDGEAAQALGGAVQRLAGLLSTLPGEILGSLPVWEIDPDFIYTYVSPRAAEILGRPAAAVIGKTPFNFMPIDEARRARDVFAQLRVSHKPFSGYIVRYQRPGGAIAVVETGGMPRFGPDGTFLGFRCTDRDIQPSGRSLDGRLAQLEAIFASTPIAQGLLDRQGRFVAVNDALAALCGKPMGEVVQQQVAALIPPASELLQGDLINFERGEATAGHEVQWGSEVYLLRSRPVRDRRHQVTGLMVAMTAITEQKRTEAKLAELNRRLRAYATYDHLTGIPNRRFFDAMLISEVRRLRRTGEPLSLVLFDVDHFKRYNDRYGHPVGDACLQQVAQAASQCVVRSTDVVCRYGGEEFVVLLPHTGFDEAMAIAECLRERIAALGLPHQDNVPGCVTVSAGVATLSAPAGLADVGSGCAQLLEAADKALYAAKAAGRNAVYGEPG